MVSSTTVGSSLLYLYDLDQAIYLFKILLPSLSHVIIIFGVPAKRLHSGLCQTRGGEELQLRSENMEEKDKQEKKVKDGESLPWLFFQGTVALKPPQNRAFSRSKGSESLPNVTLLSFPHRSHPCSKWLRKMTLQ